MSELEFETAAATLNMLVARRRRPLSLARYALSNP
jgi:hypothetical protein